MNSLMWIYNKLLEYYGEPTWWPADTPYEVIVGSILTQNTAWNNVEKVIQNMKENLSPSYILDISQQDLKEIIRPAGFAERKSSCLKAVTEWYRTYNFNVSTIQKEPMEKIRSELLSIKGVGPETADAILLYAFDFTTFVIDAYTARLCNRFPIAVGKGYSDMKSFFERSIKRDIDVYSNYHALIVIHSKTHCKKTPLCNGCVLAAKCKKRIEIVTYT